MKVLVTGGAGFIGSHVTAFLLRRGDEVVCCDNFNDFYSPVRKRKNVAQFLEHSSYSLYDQDIRNLDGMRQIISHHNVDKIVHIAAMVGVRNSIRCPILYSEVNVQGMLNVLELARQFYVQNLVFASSSSVYGSNHDIPFSEDAPIVAPISPYAATKRAGELLAYTYYHLHGLNCTCLRFFTVYGPHGRPDMAPYLFTEAIVNGKALMMFGDGTSGRDYTYIDDAVSGITAALDADLGYEIINIGGSEIVILRDFIALVERATGKKAKITPALPQPGDVPVTHADISKARHLLGYNPQTNIEEGIAHFVDWYRMEVVASE